MSDTQPLIAAVFAWLHLLAAGLGFGLLLSEYWLCRRPLDRLQAKLLGLVDLGYQLSLIGSFGTGLARLLDLGPLADQFLSNRLFWLKIGLFALVAVVAIAPSLQILRWNREARTAPAFAPLTREVERVRSSIAFGLGLWLILPLVSVLL